MGKLPEELNEEWVELLVTYDLLEAQIIKALLESGGIPVVLRSYKVTPYPVNIGKMGEVRLLVRTCDQQLAEDVMRSSGD
ncbi:MAG TPA: DUF2007 domain-containing protein [Dissulfurispiraceae bacterium]|nr:DUF2007 domain-containing protein [Dissulfurispiraceae bacterium]